MKIRNEGAGRKGGIAVTISCFNSYIPIGVVIESELMITFRVAFLDY